MIRLNLGCGNNYKEGWVNVDIRGTEYDVKHDLDTFPYPFDDNSADFILMQDVLEHLKEPVKAIHELHRIIKPKGIIQIRVPHYHSHELARDITHRRGFTLESFDVFTDTPYPYRHSDIKFKIIRRELIPTMWGRLFPQKILNFLSLFVGHLVSVIEFKLEAVK